MWESGVSVGCILMLGLWAVAFGMIGCSWALDMDGLGKIGLALSALAAALTVMRDNQRTRRMLRRSGETVAPMRSR